MIYIEVLNFAWDPSGGKKFQRYLAERFVQRIRESIEFQEYAGQWRMLNPAYKKKKIETGLSPNMWEATGELKNALYVKWNNVIGWDGRRKHSCGMKYKELARKLEYGDGNIPARPLFRLVLLDFRANLDKYYEEYLVEEGLL